MIDTTHCQSGPLSVHFSRLQHHSKLRLLKLAVTHTTVQVARVVSVEEIDSVKLYKCIVELSSSVTKQVMAGLKQHLAKDDLLHSLVVVITNLKAAKLAGELSEAMILAAQAPLPDSSNAELVKVLQPPGQSTHCFTELLVLQCMMM